MVRRGARGRQKCMGHMVAEQEQNAMLPGLSLIRSHCLIVLYSYVLCVLYVPCTLFPILQKSDQLHSPIMRQSSRSRLLRKGRCFQNHRRCLLKKVSGPLSSLHIPRTFFCVKTGRIVRGNTWFIPVSSAVQHKLHHALQRGKVVVP